ncbi:hypothetical protein PG996_011902 [Apiospora saccharicola]|uniref:F-box domain-containing protein n=1 Tax=Apiospora saccharicola TaxID=335842 RepID=A0ABR1UIS1_9PEZI
MTDDPAAPFLHRLPIEVVHLVVAQFCEHCRWEGALCAPFTLHGHDSHWMKEKRYLADTQDLQSLSLVSRALRGPAQSVLHHMCMGGFSPDPQYAFRYTHLFRFVGAVATMKTPPHLVREVKVLSLGHGHMQKMPKLWRRSLAMPEAAHLRAFMSSDSNEVAKIDFIAKLITTFPSLTHLSLGECADDSSDRVPSCLEQVEELSLTSIHVCADPGEYRWSSEPNGLGKLTARVIALSKGLRMLAVDACFEPTTILGALASPQQQQPLPPRLFLTQLRVLHLTRASLDEEELQQIISACPALCALSYRESSYSPRAGRPKKVPLEPRGVLQALDSCRHTLRFLDLSLATKESNGELIGDDSSRLAASFAGFTALQDLTVQWRTIGGPISNEGLGSEDDVDWQQLMVRALPDSIQSLSVIGCAHETRPERFARALEGLADAKAQNQQFPHLMDQEISFGLFDPGNSIRDALGAAGVRKVEYSMEWRTGFLSRARERADREMRELECCSLNRDFGPRNVRVDSSDFDDSDL